MSNESGDANSLGKLLPAAVVDRRSTARLLDRAEKYIADLEQAGPTKRKSSTFAEDLQEARECLSLARRGFAGSNMPVAVSNALFLGQSLVKLGIPVLERIEHTQRSRTGGVIRAETKKAEGAEMQSRVVAEAVRLLKAGHAWRSLASLIADKVKRSPRMVREYLKNSRDDIEQKSRK